MKYILLALFLITSAIYGQQIIKDLTVQDLKVVSTTKGSKPCPLMTQTQINAIGSPLNGQCVYNTTTNKLNVYNGSLWKAAGGGVDSWATATIYAVNDLIIESNKIYKCLIAHTSGTFATDLAASRWVEVSAGVSSHLDLTDIGTNTHAQIDSHIADTNNPHAVTKAQVGLSNVVNSDTTTTANITDSSNKRFVTDAEKTVIGNTSGINTGDLLSQGLDEGSASVTNTISAPYNQITTTATGIRNIETGSQNMLINGEIEGLASPVPNGWTCTSGTCTKTTVSGEFSSGKAALKVALSSQIMNVSQSVNTPSGIQKQGYARVIYRVPAIMADFQICSLVDAAEQTCIPSSYLVKDDTFRTAEIPLTFGTTSAGIKFKTTSSYTGNAFFDGAIVAQGLGTQNLMLDNTFSASMDSAGSVTLENTDWINGNCSNPSTGNYTCTFKSGIFTTAPNCVVTGVNGNRIVNVSPTTSSSVGIIATQDDGSFTALSLKIICQKSGNDYLSASSNAYASTNANTTWAPCTFPTLAWSGLGTVTSNLKCQRNGSNLEITGAFATGVTTSGVGMVIPIPSNYGSISIDTSVNGIGYSLGNLFRSFATGSSFFSVSPNSSTTLRVSANLVNAANNPSGQGGGGDMFATGDTAMVNGVIRIPIQDWSNSNIIVGSFDGIEKCANEYECTDTFSAKIQTTSGTVADENIDWIDSCTAANPTVCTFKAGVFATIPNCVVSDYSGSTTGLAVLSNATTLTTVSVQTLVSNTGGFRASAPFTITCQKSGVDYKPKTAKVASSIGVPTVPGLTTEAVDTFSVSYGTTNAITQCNASPCSYLDQIGNAVSSITRSGAGLYRLNVSKTYTKLKCVIAPYRTAFPTSPYHCNSCSFLDFNTENNAGVAVDTYGTLLCQGTH